MKKTYPLKKHGPRLWTRETAQQARADLAGVLSGAEQGETVTIDVQGVQVFDFSFANEFFGKTVLGLAHEYPDRLLVVDNLNEYTRENLSRALESLNLAMVDRTGGTLKLIGKVHPVDQQTFAAIAASPEPVTAAKLKDLLGIGLTAMNERLTKLVGLGVVRRCKSVSSAGREQYEYSVPR